MTRGFNSETGSAAAKKVKPENRYFKRNPEAAKEAGRKGGLQPKKRGAIKHDT